MIAEMKVVLTFDQLAALLESSPFFREESLARGIPADAKFVVLDVSVKYCLDTRDDLERLVIQVRAE